MINFYATFTDQDGDVVKQNFKVKNMVKGKLEEKNEYREIRLEDIAKISLLKSDDELDPIEILKRYQLFRKIYHKGEVDLTEEEKTLLKKLICANHDVIFAGQALELIN
jgi:hypothetical protein